MKIKIYKNEQNELMYSAPNGMSGTFEYFGLLFYMASKKELIEALGEEMPELDVQCKLDPNIEEDQKCLDAIQSVKEELFKAYNLEELCPQCGNPLSGNYWCEFCNEYFSDEEDE